MGVDVMALTSSSGVNRRTHAANTPGGGCEGIMQTRIGGSALALGQRGDRVSER
jgi:hypothetical protein